MPCIDAQDLYRRLENDFGVARAIPVARAALGLMATLRCWVEAGNSPRVALSACVCHEVIAAILGAGCEPCFCDIDPTTGKIQQQAWQNAREAGASVALIVHLYGNPVEVSEVRRSFPSPACLVIDDAAQALGSRNTAGLVGGQGDIGLLSFGPTKHIEAGNAVLLFRNPEYAARVAHQLSSIEILSEARRSEIQHRFRQAFDRAREKLREQGETAAREFHGLLDGYSPSLQKPFQTGTEHAICQALDSYALTKQQRVQKSTAWARGLKGTGLIPVGMSEGAVPWRYACRLPGIDWHAQYQLGEKMRSENLDVSHWYLPAHWLCGYEAGSLPGVESLAREIFQFWVDESISLQAIQRDASVVVKVLEEYGLNTEVVMQ